MDIISVIRRISERENVEGQSEFLSTWLSYYEGTQKALHYKIYNGTNYKRRKRKSLNLPKKLGEDFANFILNEKCEIVVPEKSQELLNDFLNKEHFWSKANANYEQAMALSLGAWVEGIEGLTVNDKGEMVGKGKLKVRYINATKIFPITIEDGKIIECAFASENTNYTNLELHLLEPNTKTYIVRTCKLDKSGGVIIDPTIENNTGIQDFYSGSITPLFQLVYPNITNNLNINSSLPVSVYANELDKIDCLDEKYDDFNTEFMNGKRRIFVNSELWKVETESGTVVKSFDENDTLFYQLNFQDNTKPMIESSAEALREQSYINAINSELTLISMGVGFGKAFYNFEGGSSRPLQTATAVVAMNSDTIRTIKKHEEVVRTALIDFVKAIRYLSNTFTNEPLGDFKDEDISVLFDDTIFEDRETEQTRDRTNVASGLMSEIEYRMRWFGENEDDAKKYVYNNLRYKLINNNLQALTSGAMTPIEFVEICYGDKDEMKKQEIAMYIEEHLTISDVSSFEDLEQDEETF